MVSETEKDSNMNSNDIDLKLISQIVEGDIDSFELLVKRYEKKIFNSAYRYVGDFHEAEDLTQEIFVKIYANLGKFQENSKFSTWVFSITMNHLKSKSKKIKRFISGVMDIFTLEFIFIDKDSNIEADVEKKELRKEVEKEILKLSPIYREVIILRDINEFSYREISMIVGISIDSVKTRIKRGRDMIVSNLKKRGY